MKPIYGSRDGITAILELDTGVYQLGQLSWQELNVANYGSKTTGKVLHEYIEHAVKMVIKKAGEMGREVEYLGRQSQVVDTSLDVCLVFSRPGEYRRIGPMSAGAAVSVRTPAEWEVESNEFLCAARGVIHIGANEGQEARLYGAMELPVIFVEPLDGPFKTLTERIAKYPDQRAYKYLLTDVDDKEYVFHVANNGGQSSSIFEFGDHVRLWPDVYFVRTVNLKSVTFKTMVEREEIGMGCFDALVMDVQGAELLVLKGMGDLLEEFRWIRCEAADFEVYKGCCQMKDLDDYLIPRGFSRVKTIRADGLPDLGYAYEALYERRLETMEVN